MCYFYGLNKSSKELEKEFSASFTKQGFEPVKVVNGFDHPVMPIILNERPDLIKGANWGLMPVWAKHDFLRKNTLNARVETLEEKSSFKNVISNRCIIPATNFYEWQWLDTKGKQKQKFNIRTQAEVFAFAGLYSVWNNPFTNDAVLTFTIITTQANSLMSEIHNNKKRMPIVLNKEHYDLWLTGKDYKMFEFPYEANLMANPVI